MGINPYLAKFKIAFIYIAVSFAAMPGGGPWGEWRKQAF
jgi:hypothetical protein